MMVWNVKKISTNSYAPCKNATKHTSAVVSAFLRIRSLSDALHLEHGHSRVSHCLLARCQRQPSAYFASLFLILELKQSNTCMEFLRAGCIETLWRPTCMEVLNRDVSAFLRALKPQSLV